MGLGSFITANFEEHTISLVHQHNLEEKIRVGNKPQDVVINSSTQKCFISNSEDNTVAMINLENRKVTYSPAIFSNPQGLAVDSLGKYLYVVNKGRRTLSQVDTDDFSTVQFSVGQDPLNIRLSPDRPIWCVTNHGSDSVTIGGNEIFDHISVNPKPYGLCFANDSLYVTSIADASLTAIPLDRRDCLTSIPVGNHPTHVIFDPNRQLLFTTNLEDSTLSVVSLALQETVKTLPIEKKPYGLALSPDGDSLYVTHKDGHKVSIIDLTSLNIVKMVNVGKDPHGIAGFALTESSRCV